MHRHLPYWFFLIDLKYIRAEISKRTLFYLSIVAVRNQREREGDLLFFKCVLLEYISQKVNNCDEKVKTTQFNYNHLIDRRED